MRRQFVIAIACSACIASAAAQDHPPVELSPSQREAVTRHITRGPAIEGPVEGVTAVTPGAEIPQSTRLYPFPHQVAEEVPAVRPYRYFVAQSRMVLVDPDSYRIVGIVPVQ